MYQFRLVQSVDGLGQGSIVAVAFVVTRWFKAGVDEALAVANGQGLTHHRYSKSRRYRVLVGGHTAPARHRVVVGTHRAARMPSYDPAGEHVDDQRNIDDPWSLEE
jgi:hypothetical protein